MQVAVRMADELSHTTRREKMDRSNERAGSASLEVVVIDCEYTSGVVMVTLWLRW
jgi:hypothetical protein